MSKGQSQIDGMKTSIDMSKKVSFFEAGNVVQKPKKNMISLGTKTSIEL